MKKRGLFNKEHLPRKAAFAAIDAHNHLWGRWDCETIVSNMNDAGIVCFCDVTANVKISFSGGGYEIQQGNIEDFFKNCENKYPGKFYCFTMATFARNTNKPLFDDSKKFVAETIELLNKHVADGAKGLKILKELGLKHRDEKGNLINVDDERLFPIWAEAARLNIPVLMHQSDPYGFFEPVTPDNEHYESLKKFPSWSFCDPVYPRKIDLLERRDNLIKQNQKTTFLLPHVANFAENLSYVGKLLDENLNVYIDFSDRMDELGRQPYTARDFFYQISGQNCLWNRYACKY